MPVELEPVVAPKSPAFTVESSAAIGCLTLRTPEFVSFVAEYECACCGSVKNILVELFKIVIPVDIVLVFPK
jgi:hypothetical protein